MSSGLILFGLSGADFLSLPGSLPPLISRSRLCSLKSRNSSMTDGYILCFPCKLRKHAIKLTDAREEFPLYKCMIFLQHFIFGVRFQLQTKRQLYDKGPEYWAFFMFCLITEILLIVINHEYYFLQTIMMVVITTTTSNFTKYSNIVKTIWKSSLLKLAGITKQNLNMGYSGRLQLNCVNIYIYIFYVRKQHSQMKQNGIRGKGNKLPIYSHNHLIKQAYNGGSSLIRVRKGGILNHVYDLRS